MDRNTLAQDRTVLSNERTYQAWLRTGLAIFATGLGITRFLKDIMPDWILLTIAVLLIVLSAVAFLLAAWRYSHIHIRMAHLDIDAMPVWIGKMLSILLAGCSVLALVGMFFMTTH